MKQKTINKWNRIIILGNLYLNKNIKLILVELIFSYIFA